MDFTPTEAQQDIAGLTRQILTDRVTVDRLRAAEKSGSRSDPELWADLAEAGVLTATLPADVGGGGFGLLEACTVLVELGRTLAPTPFLTTIATGAAALARFGSAAQRERWLAPALAGRLTMAVAVTGPDEPPVRADGGTLTGSVSTVLAGPVADAILVAVGTGVVVVLPADAGVTLHRQRTVDLDDACLLELDGVALDADRVLGPADGPAGWLRRRGTVATCAHQLGVLERALEMTAAYATTRTQFDKPIGSFQAVSQRLADAYIDVQAAGLTLWQAAWSLAEFEDSDQAALAEADPAEVDAAVATAKFWAAEAGHRVAHTAVHVHGGAGIDVEQPVHRYFTAAKRAEFEWGGATAQLRRLATALGDD